MSRWSLPGYDEWKTTDPNETDPADYECRMCDLDGDECQCENQDDWVLKDNEPDDYDDDYDDADVCDRFYSPYD